MGGICKLIIKAYSDDSFGTEKGEFKTSINPSNLRIINNINYTPSQMMGGASAGLRYNTSDPQELSFSLIFDNTGVFVDNTLSVKDQIDCLRTNVLDFQKDINEPFFVRVIWGTIDFKGKLKKFNVSYTQFQMDGSPIRAEVDMSILEYKMSSSKSGKSGGSDNDDSNSNSNNNSNNDSKNDSKKDTSQDDDGDNNNNNNSEDNKGGDNNDNNEDNKSSDQNKEDNENNGDKSDDDNKNSDKKNDTTSSNDNSQSDVGPVKQTQPSAGTTLPQLNGGVKNLDLLGKFNDLSAIRGLVGGLIAGLALGALGLAIPALLAGLLAWLLKKLLDLIKRGISFIKKLFNKAKNGAKKIAGKAKSGAKKAADKTKSAAKKGADKTKSGAQKGANKTKSGGSKVKNGAKNIGSKIKGGAKKGANKTVELFNKARRK